MFDRTLACWWTHGGSIKRIQPNLGLHRILSLQAFNITVVITHASLCNVVTSKFLRVPLTLLDNSKKRVHMTSSSNILEPRARIGRLIQSLRDALSTQSHPTVPVQLKSRKINTHSFMVQKETHST
jgi:hypothetical protein